MIRSLSTCLVVAAALAFAHPAAAQPSTQQPAGSFDELAARVAAGDTLFLIDSAGRETRGRFTALTDRALTLAVDGSRREFAIDEVRRIERRRHDSVRNGVLLGLGAGALAGFQIGRGADSPACPRSGIECGQGAVIGTVSGALWGAAGGWIADTLIRKRETIFSR